MPRLIPELRKFVKPLPKARPTGRYYTPTQSKHTQEELKETKNLIQQINRRLQQYGTQTYEITHKNGKVTTERYSYFNDLNLLLKAVVGSRRGIMLIHNDYQYISLSGESVEVLAYQLKSLRKIVEKIPTFGSLLQDTGLKRVDAITESGKIDYLRKQAKTADIIIANSSRYEMGGDAELDRYLKMFRGTNKGGTRAKGEKISAEVFKEFVDYVDSKYGKGIVKTAEEFEQESNAAVIREALDKNNLKISFNHGINP